MHADSRNTPIEVGDTVRFRGEVYTIKGFIPHTSKVEFEGTEVVADEWSVDLISRG